MVPVTVDGGGHGNPGIQGSTVSVDPKEKDAIDMWPAKVSFNNDLKSRFSTLL